MGLTFRGISLRPVREEDLPFLFQLYTDPSRCHLWMLSRRVYDEREFREAWKSWVDGLMGAKFLVESGPRPVGLVMSYDHYLEHGFAKVGAILQEDNVGHGGGVIATALLMDYLFRNLPLRKIYHEVYGFNPRVVGILGKLGFAEEGRLKGDRFWDGSYWDLHIFAAHREVWPEIRARVLRLERPNVRTPLARPKVNGTGAAPDTSRPTDGAAGPKPCNNGDQGPAC
jgi:RimJ/RimL family protein N-acetyltransferase